MFSERDMQHVYRLLEWLHGGIWYFFILRIGTHYRLLLKQHLV